MQQNLISMNSTLNVLIFVFLLVLCMFSFHISIRALTEPIAVAILTYQTEQKQNYQQAYHARAAQRKICQLNQSKRYYIQRFREETVCDSYSHSAIAMEFISERTMNTFFTMFAFHAVCYFYFILFFIFNLYNLR